MRILTGGFGMKLRIIVGVAAFFLITILAGSVPVQASKDFTLSEKGWSPPHFVADFEDEMKPSDAVSVSTDMTGSWHVAYADSETDGQGNLKTYIRYVSQGGARAIIAQAEGATDSGERVGGPSIAVGPLGSIHIIYAKANLGGRQKLMHVNWDSNTGEWTEAREIVDFNDAFEPSCGSSVSLDDEGNWHISYTDRELEADGNSVTYINYISQTGIQETVASAQSTAASRHQVGGSSISVDLSRRVHVSYVRVDDDSNDQKMMYSQRDPSSGNWSAAQEITKFDTAFFPSGATSIAADPEGNWHASYPDSETDEEGNVTTYIKYKSQAGAQETVFTAHGTISEGEQVGGSSISATMDQHVIILFAKAQADEATQSLYLRNNGALPPTITTVTPETGHEGTEVTIEGANFHHEQLNSLVAFEGVEAVEYREWSDNRIVCVVPEGALSGYLRVVTEWGESNGFNFVVPLEEVNSRQFFAEGFTGSGFNQWISILNNENEPAKAQITYVFSEGERPFIKDYIVNPASRLSINVNDETGPHREVSTKIESDGIILAERPIYFNYQGMMTGGSVVMGAFDLSRDWYFAEGFTGQGFEQWVCVLNPHEEKAQLRFDFQTSDGLVSMENIEVGAMSRSTFKINDLLGEGVENSLHLSSTQTVVAERPMYFNYSGTTGDRGWTGGHCVMGAESAGRDFFFAEGTTRQGFEQWITLQNPNDAEITVRAEYQLLEGDPVDAVYRIAANSRDTINVEGAVGPNRDVSVHLSSDEDFLAERPMYFNYEGMGAPGWRGGHCVIGARNASTEWLFAEGYTGFGFHEWLSIQNPTEDEADLAIRYFTEERGALEERQIKVPAKSRVSIFVNSNAGENLSISAEIDADKPIVVERPMYFIYSGSWDGGHCIMGFSPHRE